MYPKNQLIDIHRFLPHRAPMLMVDYISEENDEDVKTVFTIKEDNIFIQENLLIESGLVENAAQSCSAIVAKSYFLDENNEEIKGVKIIGFISGIKKLKINKLPKVGDTIEMNGILGSRYDAEGYSLCTISCKTYLKQELLLEAEINMFIRQEN